MDPQRPGRPLLIEGRSKRLYRLDDRHCVVELVPTLDSFTADRHELVPGTAVLRLDFYEAAAGHLARAGVATAFVRREGPETYVARWLPNPPFETIVKNYAVGSTLRKYPGLFPPMHRFEPPVVKFDYRTAPEDQPIADDYLRAWGLDPEALRAQARRVNSLLREWLNPLDLLDICLIFAPDPEGSLVLTSEVSPDCLRLRGPDGESYDKDLFRQGAAAEEILARWRRLVGMVRA